MSSAIIPGARPEIIRPGTRITRIGRINTDPCVSASSAQSVFYRNPIMIHDDKKPQIIAPRVTPLESVSTYALQGIGVRGVENPQGFGIDERRFVNLASATLGFFFIEQSEGYENHPD